MLEKDGIAIDEDGFSKGKGLEESVSESFVKTGIGHEIGDVVEIPKGEGTSGRDFGIINTTKVDRAGARFLAEKREVGKAFVACLMRDEQPIMGIPSCREQIDRVLDSLSRDDAGGLEEDVVFGGEIEKLSDLDKRATGLRRSAREIHHIGQNDGGKSFATLEFSGRFRVDDHMLEVGKGGGERPHRERAGPRRRGSVRVPRKSHGDGRSQGPSSRRANPSGQGPGGSASESSARFVRR